MASMGSNLRTRMSEEDYKLMCETAFQYFKERKVEISDAIITPFPFLETLRDKRFITPEKYEEFKTSWENLTPLQRVMYDVLSELEKKFNLSLLEILFSKVILNTYPDLKEIRTSLRNVILKKIFHQASAGDGRAENRNTPLIFEQGTGENTYPSLSWLFSDHDTGTALPGNRLSVCLPETEDLTAMDISTISDNNALETQRAIEQRAPEFEPVVTSSGDSVEHRNREQPPKASTSDPKRKAGSMNLGNESASQNPKKQRTGEQPSGSVNFNAEILPVTCGTMKGQLIKRKLEQGATRKCIRTEDGNWLTPREFEFRAGYQGSNWRTSLTCGGKTLKELMKLGDIHQPLITRETRTEEENSNKCKICQDGGRLYCCENCHSFFHEDCHLPPVDRKRKGWNCTFCTIESYSQSLQCCTESEVLVKEMEQWTMLKCEYLLLKVYHHIESNIFPNIPRGNYVFRASQYLGKLRKLDTFKKNLIKKKYSKVKDFKEAMDKFFEDPRRDKLHLNQEEFLKKFRKVFAIQETN